MYLQVYLGVGRDTTLYLQLHLGVGRDTTVYLRVHLRVGRDTHCILARRNSAFASYLGGCSRGEFVSGGGCRPTPRYTWRYICVSPHPP